jgi:PhnB protein
MKLEPYLHFAGNCEEALQTYARIFKGEIVDVNRYAGSPMEAQAPPDWGKKIMHATFRAPGVDFMASDSTHQSEKSAGTGPITLSIGTPDVAEGERIFNALADGGAVTMPYSKQFWGASFGMLTDRFGVAWMINAG